MNTEKHMNDLEKDYIYEKVLDEDLRQKWVILIFFLQWLEYHRGENPRVCVLIPELVTRFFVYMDHDLGYSYRFRSDMADALHEFFGFAYENKYLEHDLTAFIPSINA